MQHSKPFPIILAVLAFCLICSNLNAQSDFIVKDSVLIYGIKLYPSGPVRNTHYITLGRQDYLIRYTPYDIERYGLRTGETYVSKEILVDDSPWRVFLEQLGQGTANLYRYRTRFGSAYFIETNKEKLIPLERKGELAFREVLATHLVGCGYSTKMLKRARYSKNNLRNLFYVHNNCDQHFFSFRRLVFNFGYGYSGFMVSGKNEELLEFNPSITTGRPLTFGLSIEFPSEKTATSTITGVYLSRYKLQYYLINPRNRIESDHFLEGISINAPLIARYYFGNQRLRPFANFGIMYTHNIRSNAITYETEIAEGVRVINLVDSVNPLEKSMAGILAGAGVLYHLDFLRVISFELRYGYSLSGMKSHRLEQISLLTGISL